MPENPNNLPNYDEIYPIIDPWFEDNYSVLIGGSGIASFGAIEPRVTTSLNATGGFFSYGEVTTERLSTFWTARASGYNFWDPPKIKKLDPFRTKLTIKLKCRTSPASN